VKPENANVCSVLAESFTANVWDTVPELVRVPMNVTVNVPHASGNQPRPIEFSVNAAPPALIVSKKSAKKIEEQGDCAGPG
jgi:hypothetical protein